MTRSRRSHSGTWLRRRLNPRYAGLPGDAFATRIRILDAGAGPMDALIAKQLFSECWFEGVNIVPLAADSDELRAFDRYHVVDLDDNDLEFAPDGGYDYVISSHTIEHLRDGLAVVRRLCGKVRPGGRLYLEWPSVDSASFPLRGLGLNFFDDATHRQTYPLDAVLALVREQGLVVERAGRRRLKLRMLLAPALAGMRLLRTRQLKLYDFWDLTGFCYVARAMRPSEPQEDPE